MSNYTEEEIKNFLFERYKQRCTSPKKDDKINTTVKELAISSGILDCILDPYDSVGNGDSTSSVLVDLQRFSDLLFEKLIIDIEAEWTEGDIFDTWDRGYYAGLNRAVELIEQFLEK